MPSHGSDHYAPRPGQFVSARMHREMQDTTIRQLEGQRDELHDQATELAGNVARYREERDAWIRSWNRLEAAISHHKKNKADMFVDEVDEALYAARDRILKERASS